MSLIVTPAAARAAEKFKLTTVTASTEGAALEGGGEIAKPVATLGQFAEAFKLAPDLFEGLKSSFLATVEALRAPWVPLPLLTAWGQGNAPAQFRVSPTGTVSLRGQVTGGGSNTALGQLSPDARPDVERVFAVPNDTGFCRIRVDVTGEVFALGNTASASVNLDGVSFDV